tara:strand:- start:134 stop:835 length:702 start_codon:yes stop_codon:yes gene_type:complete
MFNSKLTRHKPIARPTSYDFNVQYDYLTNTPKRGHDFAEENVIMEGELLVVDNKKANYWVDKGMHVTSRLGDTESNGKVSLENLKESSKKGDKKNNSVKNASDFRYVGVAVTDFDPRNGTNNLMQGLVATCGGLNTLVNNGPNDIVAGEIVHAVVFKDDRTKRKSIYGVPPNKLVCCTVSEGNFNKADAANEGEETKDNDEECIDLGVVGQALTNAKRGSTFDIVLGTQFGMN